MLEVLDQKWRQHLKDLTELREGIRLRSYGQRNPIHDYKIVAFDIYNEMIDAIKRETSSFILKLRVKGEEETENFKREEVSNVRYEHSNLDENDGEITEADRQEAKEAEKQSVATTKPTSSNSDTTSSSSSATTNTSSGGTKLSGNFFLIAGAFSSESNARNRVRQLKNDGYSSAGMVGQNEKGYYLVAYRGFSTRAQAESYMPEIKNKGLSTWIYPPAK